MTQPGKGKQAVPQIDPDEPVAAMLKVVRFLGGDSVRVSFDKDEIRLRFHLSQRHSAPSAAPGVGAEEAADVDVDDVAAGLPASILDVLRSSGQRLTQNQIHAALSAAGVETNELKVKYTLQTMTALGVLTHERKRNPRGYAPRDS